MLRFVAFAFATVCWLIKIYICNLLPFPYVPSHFSYPIYFNLDPSFFLSFYFAHTFLLALFFFRSSSSYFFLHRTVSYVLLPTNFSLLSPIFRHITPVSYPSFTPYAKLHQRKVNRLYFWTQWMQEFNSVFFQRYNVLGPELTMGQWVMCQMGQHIWMVTWVMGQYLWPIEALGQCIPLPRHVLSVSRSVIRIATKI